MGRKYDILNDQFILYNILKLLYNIVIQFRNIVINLYYIVKLSNKIILFEK